MSFAPKESDLRTKEAIKAIIHERVRQEEKWGIQSHPFGLAWPGSVGHGQRLSAEENAKHICDKAAHDGNITWMDILREEFCEAAAAQTWQTLREELIHVAAVACAMVEDIDKKQSLT